MHPEIRLRRTFTLALAFCTARRITTLTTSRSLDVFDHALVWNRALSCTTTRRLHSSPYRADDQNKGKGGSALGLIKDLLSPKKQDTSTSKEPSTPAPPKQPPPSTGNETPRAEFIPKVFTYEARSTPTEQWRNRHVLPTSVQYNAEHESPGTSTPRSIERPLTRRNQEIAFKPHHRALLEPPDQRDRKEQRSSTHRIDRMKCFVQVLTTPTADTPGTTLLLHFDNKRYLVGSLAEGTQRACVQMGARLLKVSECFLTGRTEWSNTGGLIGMILTLADQAGTSRQSAVEEAVKEARNRGKKMGLSDHSEKLWEMEEEAKKQVKVKPLRIFSPPNMNHTLATARRFVFRKGMPVDIHEINDDRAHQEGEDEWAPYWADENIKVWTMSISPDSARDAQQRRVSRPIIGRKRTIDEVYGRQTPAAGIVENDLTQKERDQLAVKAVVSEMFDSSWRLDTLYETPLSQVKMPAAIFVRNAETNKIERWNGPLPGGDKPLPTPDPTVLVRRPWPGALVESLPPTEPAKEAISYIIRNHTVRGKFDPKAAERLNIQKGRKWADLASGKTAESEDGQTITPDMVLAPSKEGGGFAIVDMPDPTYIDGLLTRPEWREPKVMAGVGHIVWSCGPGVATDPRVHEFMREFNGLEHIVSSPDYCPNNIALDSPAASTIRLRKVDPTRYGVPIHDAVGEQSYGGSDSHLAMQKQHPLPEKGVQLAERGMILQLEPSIDLQRNQVIPPLDIPAVESAVPPDVLTEAVKAREAVRMSLSEETTWASTLPDKDAEVITLGTGSALPSKYRNVSATLVRIPSWGSILLDCGENTLGQLKRVFTPSELKEVLQSLRLLFISHMHADHHLGTASVIKAWYAEVHASQPIPLPSPTDPIEPLLDPTQRRLAVVSEPAMIEWLSEYSSIEDFGFSRLAPLNISPAYPGRNKPSALNWFVPPSHLASLPTNKSRIEAVTSRTIPASSLGLHDIQAVLVKHCHGARAVSITLPSGFKVSYSGDCRPSEPFTQIGQGSTVCIHEATFDDELAGDAAAKNHSTTSEALGVAQGMGARACVLTHFSQRYQKIPVLEKGGAGGSGGTEVPRAFEAEEGEEGDGEMSVNPTDEFSGPLEDVAATYPDQATNGDDKGKQYDLPKNKDTATSTYRPLSAEKPEAVKFKLTTDMKVCVAFDYMRVKVGEIGQLEKFTPALLRLFAEEEKGVDFEDGLGGTGVVVDHGRGTKKGQAQKQKGQGGKGGKGKRKNSNES
ncbi:uncharacterized protein LTR77_009762 [Saxophila tyrrhenica]|uniref:ribonuclease Z n=1 Tax=Saxophila tyrrhenica TaxID=1690608 RepID=A0AAV9NX79_9PEZI|nr:hypothetical protein LTR77_009762 [Saxophila tyrrhenica]